MISKTIIALGFGVGLLGGCGGGGNTALTTVPTAHLAISLPATTVQTDTAFTFTVTALDATNAVVPTYVGTVQITTSDTSAKLPANATLVRGVGRFTVTFKTIASQTITASDTVGNATPGTSAAISVTLGVTVSINPATATVSAGGMQAFTATVAGTSDHKVNVERSGEHGWRQHYERWRLYRAAGRRNLPCAAQQSGQHQERYGGGDSDSPNPSGRPHDQYSLSELRSRRRTVR